VYTYLHLPGNKRIGRREEEEEEPYLSKICTPVPYTTAPVSRSFGHWTNLLETWESGFTFASHRPCNATDREMNGHSSVAAPIHRLPLDILRNLCCCFLLPKEITSLIVTTRTQHLKEDQIIWAYHINQRFPTPSFLCLKAPSSLQPGLRHYRQRVNATRRQLSVASGTYKLVGFTQDTGNGNKTPCSAIVSVTGYFFQGTVNIEKGTIHNNKCEGKWQKGYFGAEKGQWTMSMQEVLPTNKGFFVYQGTLDQSGTVVKGTFTWSCFPQKVRGCFTFSVVKHAIGKT